MNINYQTSNEKINRNYTLYHTLFEFKNFILLPNKKFNVNIHELYWYALPENSIIMINQYDSYLNDFSIK